VQIVPLRIQLQIDPARPEPRQDFGHHGVEAVHLQRIIEPCLETLRTLAASIDAGMAISIVPSA